jgi:hypothetical protein
MKHIFLKMVLAASVNDVGKHQNCVIALVIKEATFV